MIGLPDTRYTANNIPDRKGPLTPGHLEYNFCHARNIAPVAAVQASYNGEDNTTQGGVNITDLKGVSGNVSANAATESFDEALDKTTVVNIVTPFFLP